MFVCIVGMDGSGKTTLTNGVLQALQARGAEAHYVYGRFQPRAMGLAFAILGRFLLPGRRGAKTEYRAYSRSRKRLFQNPVLYWGYQIALAAEYSLQVLWRVKLPLMRGRTIVCDRYYIDTVAADIALDAKNPQRSARRFLGLYRRLFPRPDVIFMSDVPAEVAFSRKGDIPSLEYASELREMYRYAASREGVIVLDGTRAPDELVAEVVERLEGLAMEQ
jgi:thymidylate kinase